MKLTRHFIALALGLGVAFFALAPSLPQVPQVSLSAPKVHNSLRDLSCWWGRGNLQNETEKITMTTVGESSFSCARDVFFLMDTTGDMGEELAAFLAATPAVTATLLASNPNTQFGLGMFQDFPCQPYGTAGDIPYERVVDLTFDTQALYDGISGLTLGNGWDVPESQLPALYQAATGSGQFTPCYNIPAGQQASFRDGATKLMLLYTSAPFQQHYPPSYNSPTFTETVSAILALGSSQVIGISSGYGGLSDLQAIAQATGALAPAGGVDCDDDGITDIPAGEPLVCIVDDQGQGTGEAIVALVEAAAGCRFVCLPVILSNY